MAKTYGRIAGGLFVQRDLQGIGKALCSIASAGISTAEFELAVFDWRLALTSQKPDSLSDNTPLHEEKSTDRPNPHSFVKTALECRKYVVQSSQAYEQRRID